MTYKDHNRTPLILKFVFFLNLILGVALICAYLSTHFSPNTIPYLYYFGLAYPILLVLTIGFILLWLVFKRKFIWFNIIVLGLGWNHLNDFYALNINQKAISANAFKIVTYNVKIFSLYDLEHREEKRDAIFTFITEENPDIICFQEFYHQKGETDFKTKDLLTDLLNLPYIQERYTHKMRGDKYFGLTTFSKYPILKQGEIAFENDPNNYCIYSDIIKDEDTIRIFNAHIGSIRFKNNDYAFFEDETLDNLQQKNKDGKRILGRLKLAYEKRAQQIEKIADEIKKSPYPIILCGDLNDTPVSYCYHQLEKLLKDAFIESGSGIGTTYIGKIPSNRIDYIFHSDNISATQFKVHDLDFSDHKPVSCIINL